MVDNIKTWMSKAHEDINKIKQFYDFKKQTCGTELFNQPLVASVFITDDGSRTIVIKINGVIELFDNKGTSLPIHDVTRPFVSFFNDACSHINKLSIMEHEESQQEKPIQLFLSEICTFTTDDNERWAIRCGNDIKTSKNRGFIPCFCSITINSNCLLGMVRFHEKRLEIR